MGIGTLRVIAATGIVIAFALHLLLANSAIHADDDRSRTITEAAAPVADTPKEATAQSNTARIHVSGHATNRSGDPIPGAIVYLVSCRGRDRLLDKTKTDINGRYEFRDVPLPLSDDAIGSFQVFGEAASYGLAWHGMRYYRPSPKDPARPKSRHTFYADDPIEMDLVFAPDATLEGTLTDEEGAPVTNARVMLSGLDYLETEGHEMSPTDRRLQAMHLASDGCWNVRTDAEGHFSFVGLPIDTSAHVRVLHSDFANQTFYAAITNKPINEYRYIARTIATVKNDQPVQLPIWETRQVMTSPIDLRMRSVRRIEILVLHEDDRKPVAGVRVTATSGKDFSTGPGIHDRGTTDEQGRVDLELPPGKYRLSATPPQESKYVRTRDEWFVQSQPFDQKREVRLQAACELVLRAVDAVNGSPIEGVKFMQQVDDRPTGFRYLTSGDRSATNEEGEFRALVIPGTRLYFMGSVPEGYRIDPQTATQSIECEPGKKVNVWYKVQRR